MMGKKAFWMQRWLNSSMRLKPWLSMVMNRQMTPQLQQQLKQQQQERKQEQEQQPHPQVQQQMELQQMGLQQMKVQQVQQLEMKQRSPGLLQQLLLSSQQHGKVMTVAVHGLHCTASRFVFVVKSCLQAPTSYLLPCQYG
jgi:hypothetical protein